jgi:hypothetical protein
MAKKQTIDLIIKAFRELGGNVSDVLGTRTNVSFLGVGDNVEPFLDKNLNTEALGVLSQSNAIDEAKNAVGFATANKLNDIQANNLLMNLNKMKEFYMPAPVTNITDLGTGARNLDAEGLGSLRANRQMDADELADFEMQMGDRLEAYDFDGTVASAKKILADDKAYTDEMFAQYKAGKLNPVPGDANREKFLRNKFEEMQASGDTKLMTRDEIEELSAFDNLPPPGSRGGPEDIAAPFQSAEETFRKLEAQGQGDLANQLKAAMMKGPLSKVTNKGNVPGKRASAREFLVEALKKDTMDAGTPAFGKTNLNDVISAEDVKFITEGGGGIGGDPLVLVEKYFGPRIAEALPVNPSNEEIIIFTNRVLTSVEDAGGLKPDNPNFDRMTARFIDKFDYRADGGRVGLRFGKLAGKAFGLAKKTAAINKSVDEGTQMGYGALRKYGLEAEDISRLFKEIAMDRTMVGPEKTQYFKMLNQVLKNPDDFPDGIIEIKKRLGMDFARGGLAKILEV